MAITQIPVTIVNDNSGNHIVMLTLLTDSGVSEELLRYQLFQNHSKSTSWQRSLLFAVKKFSEYCAVNYGNFVRPTELLQSFQSALYLGTVDRATGLDPSGLYWKPMTSIRVRVCIDLLTGFSEWMTRKYSAPTLNPLRKATNQEQILQMLAWAHKTKNSFLGHTESEASARAKSAYIHNLPRRHRLVVTGDGKKAFPEVSFGDLICRGFLKHRQIHDPMLRHNLRDVLITILLHGGGVRMAEAFQLWVHDVQEHPLYDGCALVRIGHPTEGIVHRFDQLKGKLVKSSKADYLASIGLQPLMNEVRSSRHVGWKNPTLDQKYFLEVHWSPRFLGEIFWRIWQVYMRQILQMRKIITHPYAWITYGGANPGGIYNMEHYDRAHDRAVRRVGLKVGREYGTKLHGHRHAYAKRLASFGLSETVIQRCMHHQSIESQAVYTSKENEEMAKELSGVEARMQSGEWSTAEQLYQTWHKDISLYTGIR